MINQFQRTKILLGSRAMDKLKNSRVAVFGIGGVGGYVVEALARSGVGAIDIVDSDKVCLSNINRQIIATRSTVGQYKVDAMKDRIYDINPECVVRAYKCFYLPETKEEFDFSVYDYIIDAVDTVTAKLQLVMEAEEKKVPIISSMGAGNKLNPTMFEVADIYKTSVCPLAKVMRRELKKRNIKKLKVVYSKEEPIKPEDLEKQETGIDFMEENDNIKKEDTVTAKRAIPGSVAFVPSVVGLIIASEVIKDIVNIE
ncbi:MAG: tRNA threonylcarbamoyladenosine dehydratase [Lachnospiraceae bacterium]|nr:tRNA threonylcarbamoyladenosine dehydratase [Lachnospiraceae bacterium]